MSININHSTDIITPSTGEMSINGNLAVSTVGKGLQIKEGSNATMGQATFTGTGDVTVATTAVTANSRIFLSYASVVSTIVTGALYIQSITPGTSFRLRSTGSADDSTVNWLIIEPA